MIYSEQFETEFWKPYPRTPIMSKKEAWKQWIKMAPEKQLEACRAILPYRSHLKANPRLHAVHACRFLSYERFEGLLEAAALAEKVDVRSYLV
jgi:hypothetical protein